MLSMFENSKKARLSEEEGVRGKRRRRQNQRDCQKSDGKAPCRPEQTLEFHSKDKKPLEF